MRYRHWAWVTGANVRFFGSKLYNKIEIILYKLISKNKLKTRCSHSILTEVHFSINFAELNLAGKFCYCHLKKSTETELRKKMLEHKCNSKNKNLNLNSKFKCKAAWLLRKLIHNFRRMSLYNVHMPLFFRGKTGPMDDMQASCCRYKKIAKN